MLNCVVVITFYLLVLPKLESSKNFFFLFFKLLIFFPISKPLNIITLYTPDGKYNKFIMYPIIYQFSCAAPKFRGEYLCSRAVSLGRLLANFTEDLRTLQKVGYRRRRLQVCKFTRENGARRRCRCGRHSCRDFSIANRTGV